MAAMCEKLGCNSLGTKSCGACGQVKYCSVTCQKEDWKCHKVNCLDINKLPSTLISLEKAQKIIGKGVARASALYSQVKNEESMNLLDKLIVFAEHQAGVPIAGSMKWRRSDGQEVDNLMLISLRSMIMRMDSHTNHSIDAELTNIIEMRHLLETRNQREERMLELLTETERSYGKACMKLNDLVEADRHLEQSVVFAKQMKGEGRVQSEYQAMMAFAMLRGLQNRHPEAIDFSEKAYILASDKHGPVHPDVQRTVTRLIEQLMQAEEYDRADDYCRINYENLTDPKYGFDQESEHVALGMKTLASIWVIKEFLSEEKEDTPQAEEAEKLARRSCSIIEKAYGKESWNLGNYYDILGKVLYKRRKNPVEAIKFLELAAALYRKQTSQGAQALIRCLGVLTRFVTPRRDEYLREMVMVKIKYNL